MRFSVIIPVYNSKEYLDECLNSVINQSCSDFEIIIVDDGSTDGTGAFCDNYAERDNRIKVIHKENGGASSARNVGLDNSKGEYIIFLDSDDYWSDRNALKEIDKTIYDKDADIVVFGCTDFNQVTGEKKVSRNNYDIELLDIGSMEKSLDYFLSNRLLPGGPTVFAFKNEIVKNKSIKFKTDIQDEDYDFVLSVFLNANSIYAINNPFYMYRKGRSDSVTGLSDIRMVYGIDYTIEKWFGFCNNYENNIIKKDILNYLAYIYCTGLVIIGRMNKQDREEATEIMNKNRYILDYAFWRRPKTIRILLKLVKIDKLSVIVSKYYDLIHI